MTIRLVTAADTKAFGARLAAALLPGDLLVLTGALGAGKTALVQGIGAGLGVRGPVVSPTFVIARVYRGGRIPLVHVDTYRLSSLSEVDDLDLDVDTADSVTAAEWGAGLVERLADTHLRLDVRREPDTEVRTVTLHPSGEQWQRRVADIH